MGPYFQTPTQNELPIVPFALPYRPFASAVAQICSSSCVAFIGSAEAPFKSPLASKSFNSICGLLFKFRVRAYPSEGLCVTHWWRICVRRPVLRNRRGPDTNKRGNVCHAAPARNSPTLHTLKGAASSSRQNNRPVFSASASAHACGLGELARFVLALVCFFF